jgi:hypothetical protein
MHTCPLQWPGVQDVFQMVAASLPCMVGAQITNTLAVIINKPHRL